MPRVAKPKTGGATPEPEIAGEILNLPASEIIPPLLDEVRQRLEIIETICRGESLDIDGDAVFSLTQFVLPGSSADEPEEPITVAKDKKAKPAEEKPAPRRGRPPKAKPEPDADIGEDDGLELPGDEPEEKSEDAGSFDPTPFSKRTAKVVAAYAEKKGLAKVDEKQVGFVKRYLSKAPASPATARVREVFGKGSAKEALAAYLAIFELLVDRTGKIHRFKEPYLRGEDDENVYLYLDAMEPTEEPVGDAEVADEAMVYNLADGTSRPATKKDKLVSDSMCVSPLTGEKYGFVGDMLIARVE